MYNGIINIYKEAGYTSHDVVAKMRGILKQKKIGHTGTLDPNAVGVLPVCVGNATKLCDYLTEKEKVYETIVLLGVLTDTQDMTGEVLDKKKLDCTEQEVLSAVHSFVGEYEQIPPMYSAIKVDGKRLYELARQGKVVERAPRKITIKKIEILNLELPRVSLRVTCSKGTYIRTLCSDIGEKLGCGGTMEYLKRVQSGTFTLESAITLSELETLRDKNKIHEVLIPTDAAFKNFKRVSIKDEFQKLVENGNCFVLSNVNLYEGTLANDEKVRVYNCQGRFYGVYYWDEMEKKFRPEKMFL